MTAGRRGAIDVVRRSRLGSLIEGARSGWAAGSPAEATPDGDEPDPDAVIEEPADEAAAVAPAATPPEPAVDEAAAVAPAAPPEPAIDEAAAVAPATPPELAIDEFRRRFVAGELSLERWEESCVDPAVFTGAHDDPHSEEYAGAVMDTWRAIAGREEYLPEVDEAFELDGADYLARPYPYVSNNPVEVGRYFGAVAAVMERIGTNPPARVIEYGSGWGHLALALAATGYDVTAVDLNPASVELLRRRAGALGVELDVARSTFLGYDTDRPADAIVFFESFHHCERPFELLDRCLAQLAPGGRLVFLAEAIYDHFYAPWGVRLDGSAAIMAAQEGWLELGFRRDFFEAELRGRGLDVTWETMPWLGPYGTVMTAVRST